MAGHPEMLDNTEIQENNGEKLGRREQKKIKARNDILNAAVIQFSEKGFQATSIADIMAAADMGLGTFYNYFNSKEDILISLLNRFAGDMSDELHGLMKSRPGYKVILREMVMLTAKLVGENRYLLPLLFTGAMTQSNPRGGHKIDMPAPKFMGKFLELLKAGQTSGEFRNDISPEIMAEMFHSMFQAAAFSHIPVTFEKNIEMKLTLLLAGICCKD